MENSSTWKNKAMGIHRFTLEKYSLCKGIGQGKCIHSNTFIVGGHKWAIAVYPEGALEDKIHGGDKYVEGHVYLDLQVILMSESDNGVSISLKMALLDQSGNGIHMATMNSHPGIIASNHYMGFVCFIDREVLEKSSSYLKDDCLKIECTLTVLLMSSSSEITSDVSERNFCDGGVGDDFLDMLTSGEGSDVILNVGDEKFRAHKAILSARSSVFESMFTISGKSEIDIRGVEPVVFKAVLHFIYSDTLPKKERRSLVDGYAFGPTSVSNTIGAKLLAAADKYDIKRLKSICESHLWRSISLSQFPEILSLAETYNASELKHLCFNYAAYCYGALVELDSFRYLRKKYPLLLKEMKDHISRERLSLPPKKIAL